MSLKKFFKNHISEILMGMGALTAGVLSFFITLNFYSQDVDYKNVNDKMNNEVAKTMGNVKVYIGDEPITNYENTENTAKETEYKNLEERQIYKNINVDERLNDIDDSEENLVVETRSEKVEITQENKFEEKKEEKIEEKKTFAFNYPVSGDVILEYAKEKLVYSETLQEWITHDGIDIKADAATPVKASEDGVVESIKMDPRYGNTIIISHENGYKTVYSNLSTLDMVYVGKEVKKSEIISGIGEGFGFESKEGAHVHFEIIDEKGNTMDAMQILK
ncbi:MAG: M23 family metallopeptidase [Clostridia bacterium]|nr:M23 family metallopeptidase [Clostridia bacterium]